MEYRLCTDHLVVRRILVYLLELHFLVLLWQTMVHCLQLSMNSAKVHCLVSRLALYLMEQKAL